MTWRSREAARLRPGVFRGRAPPGGGRVRRHVPTLLGKALTEQMRIAADLFARWTVEQGRLTDGGPTGASAAWTRRGVLVILANGDHADRIAGELDRAGLVRPQLDKPEHLEVGTAA